ncbi:MAG: lytic murein transglycosylase [Candidatus Wildermuthbacteria bacterium]|nr:lytic murein transglycosylase [Candidatus Wildermuthbacteria bacterium]
MKSFLKVFFPILLIAAFILASPFALAELTPVQEREQLEQELQKLEEEINSIEGDITKTQSEKKTLQGQISSLQSKIRKLDQTIAKSSQLVEALKGQIEDTSSSIDNTSTQIEGKREELSAILRQISSQDKRSFAEILLTGDTLTDFFSNIAALQALNAKNKDLLENLKDLQGYLESQKGKLESEKSQEENFKRIQILQKQESQSTKSQTEKILDQTKGKESEYQQLLADRKKQAQEIRSRIFELIGVPEAPTFGEALNIANSVASQTGVRPALLLAVLTQESSLGKNVGQCYLKNTSTGSGTRISSQAAVANVMKPSRDVQPFLQITRDLGRDPMNTPVSCPIPSVGGYGGAMGPAQFIPSTWMMYKSQLDSMLSRPADPWNIRDAFLAAGLYLSKYGAAKQDYNSEWRAAMIYFSGTTNTRYRFYGDSVMRIAAQYAEDIKALANGTASVSGR